MTRHMSPENLRQRWERQSVISVYVMCLAGFWYVAGLFSYSGYMAKEFHPELPKAKVGYYAGALNGVFFLGRFLNGIPLGFAVDYYGTMAPMMLTCASGVILPIIFAICPTYWWALSICLLYGFCNGTVLLAKVRLAYILSPERSAYPLSYIGAIWGIVNVIAPALAGSLSYAATKYDAIGRAIPGLQWFPFLLPNLIASLLNLCALCTLLIEFRLQKQVLKAEKLSTSTQETPDKSCHNNTDSHSSSTVSLPLQDEDSTTHKSTHPIPAEKTFIQYVLTNQTQLLRVTLLFAMASGLRCVGAEVFPLLLMLPQSEGGYGMGTDGIGIMSAIQGAIMIIASYLAPIITTRYGYRECTLWTILLTIPLYNSIPFLSFLPQYVNLVALTVVMGLARQIFGHIMFNATLVMSNFCTHKSYLARVSAVGTSIQSLLLFFVPTFACSVFAWSASQEHEFWACPLPFPTNLSSVFILYAIAAILTFFTALKLRPERNFPVEST